MISQTTDDLKQKSLNQVPASGNLPSGISVSSGKEKEGKLLETQEVVQKATQEIEVPKEVEKVGVEVRKETIELPPDVKKLGVTPSGASSPFSSIPSSPKISLPISDSQIMAGLHAQVTSALHWLAVWCLRKLKKAHIILKVIHGKIVRVRQ